MKFVYSLAIAWTLSVSAVAEVPTGTYPIAELEKAEAEALKRGKALAFLISDPDSKYQKTQQATTLAIKELRSYAVVVFLISRKDEEIVMPPPVVTAVRGPIGIFDPRIILLSADMTQTYAALDSEKLVGNPARETYRDLKKIARAKHAEWKAGGTPSDEFIWIKSDGKHYRGQFIEIKDGRLHVQSEKFGKGSVALDQLSPASRAYAEKFSGAPAESETKPDEQKIEDWTNSDGKTIKARFVSLIDEKLTVETEAKKSYTFPIEHLDKKSQARAKELAGE